MAGSPTGVSVSAPGSSANLGAGFDVLGLAVARRAEVGVGDAPDRAQVAPETHPAAVAHRAAGGDGAVWVRSDLPMGRGLGYSGAVRVAGAMLALVERLGPEAAADPEQRQRVLGSVSDLEGHPDNAAASVYGGLVIATADGVTEVRVADGLRLLVWVPSTTTSTDQSRTRLDPMVTRRDAVFNIGAAATFVVSCGTGSIDGLRAGCRDRLHQETRLALSPGSAAVIGALTEAGAAAWLSGSGPTVAAFVAVERLDAVIGAVDPSVLDGGRLDEVSIDRRGVAVGA
jgi:homoserine kinase